MDSPAHHASSEFEANLKSKIYTIRDLQVMLDSDLAELYEVTTKSFNQSVKRNIERFPKRFRFQLDSDEFSNLRSQFVTSSDRHGGRRYLPFVFTEQGVAMLATVLKSTIAAKVSISIMDAFVSMRLQIQRSYELNDRVTCVESIVSNHEQKFNQIFDALQTNEIPKQGLFFNGQVFDAHSFVSDLIRSAKKSLLLIDNFVDDTVLTILSKRQRNVATTIYTKKVSKQLELDLQKHNEQYPEITIKQFGQSHDRFLIIDEIEIYHIGASLKDLGKSWFAFSKLDRCALDMVSRLGR